MKEQPEQFGWVASVTSIYQYPIEVHKGYLATKDTFITALPKAGIEQNGWDFDGTDMMSGGNIIPTQLSLTWVSYAEKKFWKIDTSLPAERMLALFREGFYNYDRVTDKPKHETFRNIVVAVAPGGIVAVFLTDPWHRVEVGRYRAKETFIGVNEFYDNPHKHTQQGFFDWWFENGVPKEIQQQIKEHGIPYELWDAYHEKFNWRFTPQFYKDDRFTDLYVTYFNGEKDYFYDAQLDKNESSTTPLPHKASLYFNDYWCEAEFDWDEISSAFKTLTKENKYAQVDIIAKVGFEYNDVEFRAECNGKRIPLPKTKRVMWSVK